VELIEVEIGGMGTIYCNPSEFQTLMSEEIVSQVINGAKDSLPLVLKIDKVKKSADFLDNIPDWDA